VSFPTLWPSRRTTGLVTAVLLGLSCWVGAVAWAEEPADDAAPADGSGPVAWQAFPGGSYEGEPYFTPTLEPGESFESVVVLKNLSSAEISLTLYASDASTSGDGQFMLRQTDTGERSLLGSWFTSARSVLRLPANSEARVPFTIAVPADAPPGDYGGAVLSSLDSTSDEGQRVIARVGVRVYLRVAGDLAPGVVLSDLEVDRRASWWNQFTGEVQIATTVENTGNTRLQIGGTASAGSAFGRTEAALVPSQLELWPGDKVELSGIVSKAKSLWNLDTEATVRPSLVDGQTQTALDPVTASHRVTVLPWTPAVLLLLLGGGVTAAIRRRRRKGRAKAPVPSG
jgi:hypothetical protein